MSFWDKMLSNFAEAEAPTDLDDDALLSQMTTALHEERDLWNSQSGFLDPGIAKRFQRKWNSAYYSAKKRTRGILFSMGLTGRKIRNLAPQFIRVYEQLPGRLLARNDLFAKQQAIDAAQLILPVEGKMLDEQQMRCIAKDARNHLVLAGAGTGKTTTIVGHVKYLLKKGICSPNEILVLSFTNASAAEMSERLRREIGCPITAQIFHKLGLDIITSVQGKKPKIYSGDIRQFVRKQLDELTRNTAYLQKLCVYLTFHGAGQKSEFDFQSEDEYRSYLKFNPPVTLKKETVKSYGELDIANFLTQNGITYVYEQEYPLDTRTSEFGQYHPDFYLPNFDLYIEYFGINRQGEVPPCFSGKDGASAAQAYQAGIRWKRELHHQNKTRLIEVYAYEKQEEQLLSKLEERLKRAGVVLAPISTEKMWSEISGTGNQKLDRVAELFGTVITLVKSNSCTLNDVRGRNRSFRNLPSIASVIDLIEPIYNNYQSMLLSRSEIDFNDMINLASAYVRYGHFAHSFSHVIIDEYQDISQSRYQLLEEMRQKKDYRLFCVGDDWQSIYRFSGSDIGFILHFEKYWGASEISRIETTYRFPQSLISVSSKFIMQNPEQNQKQLRSAIKGNGFSMEKITGYSDAYSVEFLTERLKELPKGSTVFFLGRYRFDIKILDGQRRLSYRYNAALGRTEVTLANRPDLQISFMTIHSAKGLQADYVFLLNNKACGMGFPSQIADAPILQLLLDNCDHFPFAEERRLFYVAITRARKKVWLVTRKGNESVFVEEIDAAYGEAMRREQYTCPLCGGRLVRRSGPYGDFYGCSGFKTTGCRYKRNIIQRKSAQASKQASKQVTPSSFGAARRFFAQCFHAKSLHFSQNTAGGAFAPPAVFFYPQSSPSALAISGVKMPPHPRRSIQRAALAKIPEDIHGIRDGYLAVAFNIADPVRRLIRLLCDLQPQKYPPNGQYYQTALCCFGQSLALTVPSAVGFKSRFLSGCLPIFLQQALRHTATRLHRIGSSCSPAREKPSALYLSHRPRRCLFAHHKGQAALHANVKRASFGHEQRKNCLQGQFFLVCFSAVSGRVHFGPVSHILPVPANTIFAKIRSKGSFYMKATGIVRRIDDLGRVVIPKEIRRTMRIREGDPLQTTLTRWERFCFAMGDLAKRQGWE